MVDIAALQYLDGTNTSTQAANLSFTDNSKTFQAVWAPNGVAVDASATARTNIFDMRAGDSAAQFYAGSYSSTVVGGAGTDTLFLQGKLTDWTVGASGDFTTFTHKTTNTVISAKGIEQVKAYLKTAAAV